VKNGAREFQVIDNYWKNLAPPLVQKMFWSLNSHVQNQDIHILPIDGPKEHSDGSMQQHSDREE